MKSHDFGNHTPNDPLKALLHNLVKYPFRWIIPAALVIAVVSVFASNHRDKWEAMQAVLVRSDSSSSDDGSGEFRNSDEMKRVEETILEVARSRPVIDSTLKQLGADANEMLDDSEGEWPTRVAIAQLREAVQIDPPKGAEFGKTEIFYVKVQAYRPERAMDLVSAVCRNLQVEFARVREARVLSTIVELKAKMTLANEELAKATRSLTDMESKIGEDLPLLRMLEKAANGQADVTNSYSQAQRSLRSLRSDFLIKLKLLDQLRDARQLSEPLDGISSDTLAHLPELQRLKEALTETELEVAHLSGNMTDKYPLVIAAQGRVSQIREMIAGAIEGSIQNLRADTEIVDGRAEIMETDIAKLKQRLSRVAQLRAEYSNLLSRVDNGQELVAETQRKLADAAGRLVAVADTNLINPIGEPECSDGPVGPSQSEMVLIGIAGGLITGLGFLVLTAPFGVSSYQLVPVGHGVQPNQLPPSANYIEYQPVGIETNSVSPTTSVPVANTTEPNTSLPTTDTTEPNDSTNGVSRRPREKRDVTLEEHQIVVHVES